MKLHQEGTIHNLYQQSFPVVLDLDATDDGHVSGFVNFHARSVVLRRLFSTMSALFLYSSLSNIIGSTLSARRAGIQVATSPSIAIARTTPANTTGSRGVA